MSSTARVPRRSPTPTRSSTAMCTQSWSPTSRTPRSNGSSTAHGTGPYTFPGPASTTTTSARGRRRTRKRPLTGSPLRSPGAASTPSRRSSSTLRTAPTVAKRSSTATTGRWRGTSSSASRCSPTSGPSRHGGCRRRSRRTPRRCIRARTRPTSRRRHPSSAPCTTRSATRGYGTLRRRRFRSYSSYRRTSQNTAIAIARDSGGSARGCHPRGD